jgi:hypothetical protein
MDWMNESILKERRNKNPILESLGLSMSSLSDRQHLFCHRSPYKKSVLAEMLRSKPSPKAFGNSTPDKNTAWVVDEHLRDKVASPFVPRPSCATLLHQPRSPFNKKGRRNNKAQRQSRERRSDLWMPNIIYFGSCGNSQFQRLNETKIVWTPSDRRPSAGMSLSDARVRLILLDSVVLKVGWQQGTDKVAQHRAYLVLQSIIQLLSQWSVRLLGRL